MEKGQEFTVRIRRARKITTTKAAARAIIPGIPKSSAKPVSGNPVEVGVVVPPPACWVSRAETVAVRGSIVGCSAPAGVSVGASTGVGLDVTVMGAGVNVTVGVGVQA